MKIVDKISRDLNDHFRDDLKDAMKSKFNIAVTSQFDFLSMRLATIRDDNKAFTDEHMKFMEAFEEGYQYARDRVRSHG